MCFAAQLRQRAFCLHRSLPGLRNYDPALVEGTLRHSIVPGMMTKTEDMQGRTLLGLRPPAELAESGPESRRVAAPAPPAGTAPPARPNYPVVSSGWDAEDAEGKDKSSDLSAALRAGVVLLVFILALALLLR
jgi:hypothetical protein